jgi:exonuclease III
MRILTWNCSRKFRTKCEAVLPFGADIMVIQEAEQLDWLEEAPLHDYPHRFWVGGKPDRGLLVLARPHVALNPIEGVPEALRSNLLPLRVVGPQRFDLFAIWTWKAEDDTYTGQVREAIDAYEAELREGAVLVGDWNSNAVWDDSHPRATSHTQLVERLAGLGLASAYHEFTGEAQGAESRPTHANLKKLDRACHIDHCFVSRHLLTEHAAVEVGELAGWLEWSDHTPMVVDL